jgi:uncharacterized protein YqeY
MSEVSIFERLQADITAAMKARDSDTLSTLRMLKAALMEAKTKKPKDAAFSADEEVEVLQRYAKKRRETIAELEKIGRKDLVAREEQEIAVTSRYLPEAMSEEELEALVREAVGKVGATSSKDAGKVIGAVMAEVKGRADGGSVARLVRRVLGG